MQLCPFIHKHRRFIQQVFQKVLIPIAQRIPC